MKSGNFLSLRGNCRALHPIDVRERFDFFDVRLRALGVIFEYCLSGLKAAAPVVEPNTAADSAAAPLSTDTRLDFLSEGRENKICHLFFSDAYSRSTNPMIADSFF